MSKWIAEFDLEDGDTMPEHMDLEYKGAKLDFHCRLKEPRWIPIVIRPLTDEERKDYGVEIEFIYDCLLPEDGQDVLVTTPYGVRQTTFYTDYGCYFENYEDEGDVIAWCELPQPYAESEGKKMTKEAFEKGKNIIENIQSLKNIKNEYENRHWVSFYGAAVKEQPITNEILRDDLEKFVDGEIAKLEKELEKL